MIDSDSKRCLLVAELAEKLGAEYRGDGAHRIESLSSMHNAEARHLCFVSHAKFLPELQGCRAGAVLLRKEHAEQCEHAAIFVDNPYFAYAQVSQWLHGAAPARGGVHSTAVIDPAARISPSAEIGPHVVVEADVVIADDVVIGAGCFVGLGSRLGQGTRLSPNVTVHHHSVLGESCRVLSGSVIGADGFGFAPVRGGGWHRIEQIGRVVIGDRVEIGACTTVDRGALDDTVIEDGVIIDNHVQVAHNVHIGENTAIAGCVGIAGSTRIGRHCQLGGGSSIVGHLTIDDGVVVFANTFVTSSLQAGVYASASAAQPVADWRRNQPNLRQFHQLARQMRRLVGKVRGGDKPAAEPSE